MFSPFSIRKAPFAFSVADLICRDGHDWYTVKTLQPWQVRAEFSDGQTDPPRIGENTLNARVCPRCRAVHDEIEEYQQHCKAAKSNEDSRRKLADEIWQRYQQAKEGRDV